MDTDTYGMPEKILGPHPDEFYGAVGRIACVSAVLEQNLAAVRHTLALAYQGQHTREPVGTQIQMARGLANSLPAERRARVHAYLDSAKVAVDRRNAIVHSAFPAQASGQLIGHRPVRDKTVLDGRASWTETSPDDLRELIGHLSQLVLEFNGVYALCQPAEH